MNDRILENYQIRKSNKEKTKFIGYLKERLSASGYDPEKDITIENFKKGIGVCALNKSPLGMYCARIHTPKDTVCREENVKVLAETMMEFVGKV